MVAQWQAGNARIPVLGFVAPSGTGKTTLLRQVLALLKEQFLHVGVLKQAREDFDVDRPGKDSYRLREAGVERLLLASDRTSALVVEHPDSADPELNVLLALFEQQDLDLILVEGFSEQSFPKIELDRAGRGLLRYRDDPSIIALATDRGEQVRASIPVLDIDNPAAVAEFVLDFMWQ